MKYETKDDWDNLLITNMTQFEKKIVLSTQKKILTFPIRFSIVPICNAFLQFQCHHFVEFHLINIAKYPRFLVTVLVVLISNVPFCIHHIFRKFRKIYMKKIRNFF